MKVPSPVQIRILFVTRRLYVIICARDMEPAPMVSVSVRMGLQDPYESLSVILPVTHVLVQMIMNVLLAAALTQS